MTTAILYVSAYSANVLSTVCWLIRRGSGGGGGSGRQLETFTAVIVSPLLQYYCDSFMNIAISL